MSKKTKKTKKTAQAASPKPKSKRRSKNNGAVKKILISATPFILLAVALFFETCLILGGEAGAAGALTRKILYGLFGLAAHAISVSAIFFAFFFGEIKKRGRIKYKSIMASALVITLAALNSLVAQNGMKGAAFSFKEFFESGVAGKSGGVFGGFFALLASKLITPIGATVLFAVAAATLLTFTVGVSRLGLWRAFSKNPNKDSEVSTSAKPTAKATAKKKPSLSSLKPNRIDTVVSGEIAPIPAIPELAPTPEQALIPEQLGAYIDEEDFTEEDFDEINGTDEDDFDFGIPEETQNIFTPTQLMEQFGIDSDKNDEMDIYAEEQTSAPAAPISTPAPAPKAASAPAPKKNTPTYGGISYSPFATLKSQEEVFKAPPPSTSKQTKKPQAGAYSPFADPFRSIEEKKPLIDKNSEVWDEIKQNAPSLSNKKPAPTPAAPLSSAVSQAPETSAPAQVAVAFAPRNTEPARQEQTNAPATANSVFDTPVYSAPAPNQQPDGQASAGATAFAPRITDSAFDAEIVAPAPEDNKTPDAPDPRIKSPYGIYNKLRYPRYVKPSTTLLDPPDPTAIISEKEIYEIQSKLHTVFENFHVNAAVTGYSIGPSITRYEITPGPGVKTKQITSLGEDIALALQSENRKGDIRIVTVQGKSVMGVEVPNSTVTKVPLRTLIENKDFQKAKSKITVCVGVTVSGKPIFMDIDDMPHVLVAGQTKSGKSVAINCMIISLLYRASPDEVQLILIDPKRVELSIYNDVPHMIMPVIDEPKRAAAALKWAVSEMERRYDLLNKARVRNRKEYYATRDQNPDFEYMPQIVIIIDELADLMLQMRDQVEDLINRLAAMARACGMHVVIGTQRPSVDVVTGLIKANIPSHIAFKVSSQTDSRVILGNVGAEKLLGRGDMLYHPTDSNQIRAQGAFIDTTEIKRILSFIIEKNGKAEYDPEVMYTLQSETDKLSKVEKKSAMEDDCTVDGYDPDFDLLCQAAELVLNMGKATTNVIQRHLKIGFNRAANIVEKLEDLGFISAPQGSKPREVLVDWKTYEEWKNSQRP